VPVLPQADFHCVSSGGTSLQLNRSSFLFSERVQFELVSTLAFWQRLNTQVETRLLSSPVHLFLPPIFFSTCLYRSVLISCFLTCFYRSIFLFPCVPCSLFHDPLALDSSDVVCTYHRAAAGPAPGFLREEDSYPLGPLAGTLPPGMMDEMIRQIGLGSGYFQSSPGGG